jgi:hypothetical protein
VFRTFEEETESMRGRAVFTSFYEQLKSIRAFHLKYPHTPVVHEPSLDDALNPQLQVRLRRWSSSCFRGELISRIVSY